MVSLSQSSHSMLKVWGESASWGKCQSQPGAMQKHDLHLVLGAQLETRLAEATILLDVGLL
jgi:hypothetical protein